MLGLRPAPEWEFGGSVTYATRQDDVPEESLPGDAFTVIDVFASWCPEEPMFDGAVLRVGIDNVFDEEYMIYPNGLNQPGRTYKISAGITF